MNLDNQFVAYILTPPSINGERCRWLMQYFGIKYQFNQLTIEPLALIPALRYSRKAKGSKYVYFVNQKNDLVFRDPLKLMDYLNPMFDEDIRMEEDDSEVVEEILALSSKYIRPWSYGTFGPRWSVFLRIMTHHVPLLNRLSFYLVYPLIFLIIKLALKKETTKEAEEKLEHVFDLADPLFADGREFLNGERMSYSDIALSTNLSPLVLPPEYGVSGTYPAPEDLPSSTLTFVEKCRQRPTGKYILNLFKNHRLN